MSDTSYPTQENPAIWKEEYRTAIGDHTIVLSSREREIFAATLPFKECKFTIGSLEFTDEEIDELAIEMELVWKKFTRIP